MELKAIIAIALVVFIIGGLNFPESQKPEEVTSQGRPCGPPLLHTKKERSFADERTI